MNKVFRFLESKFAKTAYFWLFVVAILLIASSIAKLFLPTSSTEYHKNEPFSYYLPYRFDEVLNLSYKESETVTKDEPTSQVLATLKNFKLKAIYAESDGTGFIALEEKNSITFLATGESVSGYRLQKVEATKAIFMRSGTSYELQLEEPSKIASRYTQVDSAVPSFENRQQMKQVAKTEIEKYKDDARLIWDNIGINPITENGQFKEFRITFVARGSIFEQLGLMAGDVLKAANGIELDGYAAALRLYAQMDKIEDFKLTIIRNNQIRELEYEIR